MPFFFCQKLWFCICGATRRPHSLAHRRENGRKIEINLFEKTKRRENTKKSADNLSTNTRILMDVAIVLEVYVILQCACNLLHWSFGHTKLLGIARPRQNKQTFPKKIRRIFVQSLVAFVFNGRSCEILISLWQVFQRNHFAEYNSEFSRWFSYCCIVVEDANEK